MKLKKLALVFALFCMTASMTGCWSTRELDNLAILMALGVDKSDTPGMIDVTAQAVVPSAIGTPGGGSSAEAGDSYFNTTATGRSLIGVLRDMTHTISRKLYTSHTQVLVVGSEQAKENMQECLDLFVRDHEERLNVQLVIADGKASDLLDTKPMIERIPSVNIERLMETQFATSTAVTVQIVDFLKGRLSESEAAYAPLFATAPGTDGSPMANVVGLALFHRGRMTGQLDGTTARGLLFARDQVFSGIVEVPVTDGYAQIEMMKSKTKSSVKVNRDNRVTLNIEVKITGNIAGKISLEDISTEGMVRRIEKEVSRQIEDDIRRAYAQAADFNTDVFLVGDMVWKHFPRKWPALIDNWNHGLGKVNLAVKVDVRIQSTGRITNPVI